MASAKICDRCNQPKPDVKRIQVHIVLFDVVIEGQPTGTAHEAEVCDACRSASLTDIHENARAQLERDIPRHKEMIRLRDVIAEATVALKRAVRERDSLPKDAPEAERSEATASVSAIVAKLAKAEADYKAVAEE
jgi:hypothetical protein